MIKKVLAIAGSDSSGGAGIQADIKTITVHKKYAMSVITALTSQNTLGVSDIYEISHEFVASQLDSVFTDIFPDSIKIGMVSNTQIIKVIAEKMKFYNAKNIVVDPVMVSTSGSKLICDDARKALINYLFPIANVITPNINEAQVLCDMKIETENEMIKAAEKISALTNGAVLLKGGHFRENANDLLYKKGKITWLCANRIDNKNTHGTGCTLSSAIACNLADGLSVEESVRKAKNYVYGAINAKLDIGKGRGPLNHMYRM